MSPTLDAFLRSWPFDPLVLLALLVPAGIYLRGWTSLKSRDATRWHAGQPAAFVGGLATIFLALASPIEPFAGLLLQVHMVQHLLLMMAAPALLWLGEPLLPILFGLPESIRKVWFGPLLRSAHLRRLLAFLTHPLAALPLFTAVAWLWHLPAAYELALRSPWWHHLQHACFVGAGLLFWYPVVRPHPARPTWSLWLLVPYLLLADVQNTILSALLTFSSKVLYPWYLEVPALPGMSALEDQSAAGVIMWIPGSLVFLLPLFSIGVRLLAGCETIGRDLLLPPSRGDREGEPPGEPGVLPCQQPPARREPRPPNQQPPARREPRPPNQQPPARREPRPPIGADDKVIIQPARRRIPLPLAMPETQSVGPSPRHPGTWIASFSRWRHARLAMQLPLMILAGLLIVDGLLGPAAGPMNLAGVLPWIHWRGLVILGLLAAGNLFCMACPFLVPRTLGRRWFSLGWSWPRRLRNKWLAVGLLGLFLWAYEALALWDSPWWTAWLAIGYFVTAFVVDSVFRGAAFCKYVCPIGQFNFVQSLISPLEVKVTDPQVCVSCRTKDCIRGRDGIPGCELHLYQPRKAGNMDCTFCLDCIHACPHDNVGLQMGTPGRDLWHDSQRSGIGQFSKRPDLAALVLILVFGAFANAAGMVGPVLEWQESVRASLGGTFGWVVGGFQLLVLVVVPVLLLGTAASLSRRWGQLEGGVLEVATRYSYSLVPLGFAMWLAHYSFHFLTSADTLLPVLQRCACDAGLSILGEPQWSSACCRPVGDWLSRLEILFLDVGLLLSLYTVYRITASPDRELWRIAKTAFPWGVLLVLLFVVGVWICLQPMQMRGTVEG